MAFDGLTIAALVDELNTKLNGGRFFKIAQPEPDELLITIKNIKDQYRLMISANPSLPLTYITEENKVSPLVAPNFCMLLRKHIGNAKILSISQPNLERIINFELEHYDEMGDLCRKTLTIELMGKHSNIIFTKKETTGISDTENPNDNPTIKIIDSIKHINGMVSSVREVLPGREYFIPDTMHKHNPITVSRDDFISIVTNASQNISKAIYVSFTGISPIIAEEICYRANVDSTISSSSLNSEELLRVYDKFSAIMNNIKANNFTPLIYYKDDEPVDFAIIPMSVYSDLRCEKADSISSMLERFYGEKNAYTRIKQKSYDLRKIVQTLLEKDYKKYDLQLNQLKDTEKKEKFKIYGELLTTYGYSVALGDKSLTTTNYYDNTEVTIPLDETLTAIENAKRYFDKYTKLKRTAAALEDIIVETKTEIDHLESITTALDLAENEDDLKGIKEELVDSGYIRRKSSDKKAKYSNKPLHYVSTDGFDIYVGKNNFQNEEVTFKIANGGDLWFHSKSFPGSHVILKTGGREVTDLAYEEAAALAAYYSKGRNQDKVEIDYIERKQLRKTPGAKAGFVIYHTNYSMAIAPDITKLKQVNE